MLLQSKTKAKDGRTQTEELELNSTVCGIGVKPEGDQGGTHYVLDSLSLPHTPDGNAFAAATAAVLLQSYVAMRTESLQANVKMLCSADGKARSNLDIYKTLDSMDDVAATVAAKHYLIAQRQFEPSALDLVLAEVASKKSTLFYAKFDHQVAYEKQGIDPQSFVVEICDNIRSELESLTN